MASSPPRAAGLAAFLPAFLTPAFSQIWSIVVLTGFYKNRTVNYFDYGRIKLRIADERPHYVLAAALALLDTAALESPPADRPPPGLCR